MAQPDHLEDIALADLAGAYGLTRLPASFPHAPLPAKAALAKPIVLAIRQAAAAGDEQSRAFLEAHRRRRRPDPSPLVDVIPVEPKKCQQLAVVTTYFNPVGYSSLRANYRQFADGMQAAGVELYAAELAFGRDPFFLRASPRAIRLRGNRRRNLLWQKERLLNMLAEQLPADVDAIAWIDADIVFLNRQWVADTLAALETAAVAQLFEDVYHWLPAGQLESLAKRSVAAGLRENPKHATDLAKYHPGFAWAMRRDVWEASGGLLDTVATGGGDSLMIKGFTGRTLAGLENQMNRQWLAEAETWAAAMFQRAGGRIGVVPGTILHLWHGSQKDRRYVERWRYLTDHGFCPATDLARDQSGLWQWSALARKTKPEMLRLVAAYFSERNDDGTPV